MDRITERLVYLVDEEMPTDISIGFIPGKIACSGFFLDQLQQDPISAFGMEEDGAAFCGKARLLVENGGALIPHLLKSGIDIINFETDMMQTFAALLQKLHQTGIGRCRLD